MEMSLKYDARIQDECSNYGEERLILGDLMKDLKLGAKHLYKAMRSFPKRKESFLFQIFSMRGGVVEHKKSPLERGILGVVLYICLYL